VLDDDAARAASQRMAAAMGGPTAGDVAAEALAALVRV
jgi:hypothetical protein